MCIRHFQDTDLKQKGNKKVLVFGAIPSIFSFNQDSEDFDDETKTVDNNIGMATINESILRFKVADLKREILLINTDNDIKVQTLERKILSLENDKKELSDKLKECHVQRSQEKVNNAKLEKQISALKKERYISWDDSKFSNVINEYLYVQNPNNDNNNNI